VLLARCRRVLFLVMLKLNYDLRDHGVQPMTWAGTAAGRCHHRSILGAIVIKKITTIKV